MWFLRGFYLGLIEEKGVRQSAGNGLLTTSCACLDGWVPGRVMLRVDFTAPLRKGEPDRQDLEKFGLQGWPGKHIQPGSSGRHSLRTGFLLGPRFFPFCFSLKLSNPGTAVRTARTSPFAWRCVQACSVLVQVGHLIANPAQTSPCTGTPATLLSSKVAFVDHEGRRGHFLYTALPYICAAGRGEGVTGKSYGGLTTHSHFSFLPGEGEPDFHSFFFFF